MTVLFVFLLLIIALAALLIDIAFSPDTTSSQRWYLWIGASTLLALPVLLAGSMIRRKWKTGRFLTSPEERQRLYARSMAKQDSPGSKRGQKFVYMTGLVFWPVIAGFWVYSTFHHPEKRPLAVVWLICAALSLYIDITRLRNLYRKPAALEKQHPTT
jgi:hypothetical protein